MPQPSIFDMASAVAEAKRRYPREAGLPMVMTYNPQRAWNSETFPPREDANPRPGFWNVEMGRAPYAQKRQTWPELVGLEGLHGLWDTDPTYQQLTRSVVHSYTPEQMRSARQKFNRDVASGGIPLDPKNPEASFQNYLHRVDAQEVIRGRIWGKMFHDVEHPDKPGPSEMWDYTPGQIRLLDDIQSYLQSR